MAAAKCRPRSVILSASEGSLRWRFDDRTVLTDPASLVRSLCPSRTGVVYAVRDDAAPWPLFQNAGVITDQRISYGGGFASEPLLQPSAEAVPEIPRTLIEKSLRQIDSPVL